MLGFFCIIFYYIDKIIKIDLMLIVKCRYEFLSSIELEPLQFNLM